MHIDAGHEWRGGQQQVFYLLHNMVHAGYETRLICPDGSPLAVRCRKAGLPVGTLPLTSRSRLKDARRIAQVCRREGVDIIHAHCSHSLTLALLARLFYRRPKIVAARRVDFHVKKPVVGAWKYRTRLVDRIICVSDAIRDIIIHDGVPANKVVTVRSGVDLHKFGNVSADGLREEFAIPADHTLIVTVAALVGHKDYPTLLRAAQRVMQKNEKVTFLAAGDGHEKVKLLALAKELNLGNRFIFAGHRADVGRFLKAADIFVMASKTEGLGTSLLDAQAAGCAIVATRAGGIPEIIKDGETGVLVPTEDPATLAGAVLALLEEASRRKQLSEAAKNGAEFFSHTVTFKKTIDEYQSLLHQKRH